MNRNYLTTIEGNEATLEAYVAGVFAGTCRASGHSPHPYQLRGYPDCLDIPLVEYFLQQPFDLARAKQFYELLRQLSKHGYADIYYEFDKWVEATIKEPYFLNQGDEWHVQLVRRPGVDGGSLNPDYIRFMCFLGVCHSKYGPSYASVTANRYFGMATDLGSTEPARLRAEGSGTLPRDLTHYEDADVRCVANDAFATILIAIKTESAASYARVLRYLLALLQGGFPRSYAIKFASLRKEYLPIRGLPKKGAHALAAAVVRYPELHPLLAAYATQAPQPDAWYTNLEGADCAQPGTFAVFALGLVGEEYFDLVSTYLRGVDEEHQEIQTKFTAAFVEKFGITARSFPVFLRCLLSTQSHKHYKVFAEQFTRRDNLERLLAYKRNFAPYLPQDADKPADWTADPAEAPSLTSYLWEDVLHAIFGPATRQAHFLRAASPELRPLYAELFSRNR